MVKQKTGPQTLNTPSVKTVLYRTAQIKTLYNPYNKQTIMSKRILDFKTNKIEQLTIEELEVTKRQKINGKAMHGIYHFELIQSIFEQLEKAGLTFDVPVLFAVNNADKRMPGAYADEEAEEEYGEGNIRAYTLNRIFSQINVTSLEDTETSTAIGLSYNQFGVQLAFGPNLKVCTNLCIMGAESFMSTYSHNDKMPNPQRMVEVLSDWLNNFEEERARDLKIMNGLQNISVPHKEVMEIIGDLTTMRVRKENSKMFPKQPVPPLHGGQISKFALKYLSQLDSEEGVVKVFSAWDLYNFATDMYKPGQTDMPLILSNNYTMSQYLISRYEQYMN